MTTTKQIPIFSVIDTDNLSFKKENRTKNRIITNLSSKNSKAIKISESNRKNLRNDLVNLIELHSERNKERNNHLSNIHNQDILAKDSFIWLIADARSTGDRLKELEYSKKFYEDSFGTEVLGFAAYTYGKVLIDDEEKGMEAKKMFEIAFFQGGYIDAINKLSEYFGDDIKTFYKEKIENDDMHDLEYFFYAAILLSDKIISEDKASYIMDILSVGVGNEDNNCLLLYHHMLQRKMGSREHQLNKDDIADMMKANFSDTNFKFKPINNALIGKMKKEKEFKPQEHTVTRSLADLQVIYKQKKNSRSNSPNEDRTMETDEFDTLAYDLGDLNDIEKKGPNYYMGNLLFGNNNKK
ncbi:11665_t:CDS:1 [Scutellospora calospora]|uniref:11665_t:CDS:1 n=1 Tax=Scutellospora calospora TaxID=85575 RepID=A0ACA9KLH1_9GLOM|nr:11665_t:CDS:1 [Scutellospora calospora]